MDERHQSLFFELCHDQILREKIKWLPKRKRNRLKWSGRNLKWSVGAGAKNEWFWPKTLSERVFSKIRTRNLPPLSLVIKVNDKVYFNRKSWNIHEWQENSDGSNRTKRNGQSYALIRSTRMSPETLFLFLSLLSWFLSDSMKPSIQLSLPSIHQSSYRKYA